jgi:hypothetical protein
VAGADAGAGHEELIVRIVGEQRLGRWELFKCLRILRCAEIEDSEIVVGEGVGGVEHESVFEFSFGADVIFFVEPIEAEVFVRAWETGVERDGFAIVSIGDRDLAELGGGDAQKVFDLRDLGMEALSLFKLRKSSGELLLAEEIDSLVEVGIRGGGSVLGKDGKGKKKEYHEARAIHC